MKVTVESMGQFCAARAVDLSRVSEVISVAGGTTSNAGVSLRMGAMEALEGLIRDLQQAAKDADESQVFDGGETFPPADVQMPGKFIQLQNGKRITLSDGSPVMKPKRGRKPKAVIVADGVLPGQVPLVAGVMLPGSPSEMEHDAKVFADRVEAGDYEG